MNENERDLKFFKERLQRVQRNLDDRRSHGKILRALLDAQRAGHLSGILGRLGDLGAIDQKYDIAVSTACSLLDYIVVETIKEAERCIQFLRENEIGKGQFMGLDIMNKNWQRQREKPFYPPKYSLRLFDQIKVQDIKILNAFFGALKDTLVCEDINTATAIAYGAERHRVVTIQGALIEKSGTMSGGGNPRRGGMSSQMTDQINDDYDTMIRDVENLEATLV